MHLPQCLPNQCLGEKSSSGVVTNTERIQDALGLHAPLADSAMQVIDALLPPTRPAKVQTTSRYSQIEYVILNNQVVSDLIHSSFAPL